MLNANAGEDTFKVNLIFRHNQAFFSEMPGYTSMTSLAQVKELGDLDTKPTQFAKINTGVPSVIPQYSLQ